MRKVVSILLALLVVFTLQGAVWAKPGGVPAGGPFSDSSKFNKQEEFERRFREADFVDAYEAQWAHTYMVKMQVKGVIQGRGNNLFVPNASVTHAEATTMVVRMVLSEFEDEEIREIGKKLIDDGFKFSYTDNFNKSDEWYLPYLAVAVELGIADNEGKFQGQSAASREWVAKLLIKALDYLEEIDLSVELADTNLESNLIFTDSDAISAAYRDYVAIAVKYGIINGYPDGTFKPNKPVTRAEMAKLTSETDNLVTRSEAGIEKGIISAINSTSVTLQDNLVFEILDTVKVYRDGQEVPLESLSVGEKIEIFYNSEGQAYLIFVEVQLEAELEIDSEA